MLNGLGVRFLVIHARTRGTAWIRGQGVASLLLLLLLLLLLKLPPPLLPLLFAAAAAAARIPDPDERVPLYTAWKGHMLAHGIDRCGWELQ
jgi:hypothetical protein